MTTHDLSFLPAGRTNDNMSCPFSEEQVGQLKAFVEACKAQPLLLHHPKLAFFKDYLVSLGVSLPAPTFGAKSFTPAGDTYV